MTATYYQIHEQYVINSSQWHKLLAGVEQVLHPLLHAGVLVPVVLLSLDPLHGVFPGILPSTCSTGLLTSGEGGNVQPLVQVLEGNVGIVVDDE